MEWALYPGNSSCTDYFCFIVSNFRLYSASAHPFASATSYVVSASAPEPGTALNLPQNRLRDDIGVSALTLVGTGNLGSMSMRTMHGE